MVDLAALADALVRCGVRVSVADFQALVLAGKLSAGLKQLITSGGLHDSCVCPLHRGFVFDTSIPETQPQKPLILANKQGFDLDCIPCFIEAGKTVDHVWQKGFTV